ncbi:MAG: uracil-DNA glycosylase [Candidatus Abawacabacteria bacterium]|nr:uracil-DNA glycosylase [Candidatus Abawacabacteria bacterium]
MEALNFLAEQIKKCHLCRLGDTRTNAVPGYGNPESPVLFVGEGPGKNEDEKGLPFVGAAGKFLDKCLDSIGWKREDVFITNVVKCRPPENRDPLPDEITTCCNNYLKNQIRLIKPLLIVTLGRHSLELFLPGKKISEVHGKAMRTQGENGLQVYLALYHPAAALYNGGLQSVLLADFQKIPALLEQLKNTNA